MSGINDNLIEDYRAVVTNTLLANETIVEILSNNELTTEKSDELLWKHLIPQQYVPDTITDTGSFVMFDLDENNTMLNKYNNSTYTEIILYFWIFTHKDMPSYEGRLRNDILVKEIKNLFCYKDNLGIMGNRMLYNKIFSGANTKYAGRLMAFKIVDWSDKIRNKENNMEQMTDEEI